MASINSTLYTIGTALARAKDAEVSVELLVTGQWVEGRVSALDGHGIVLYGAGDELSIVRMQSIDAVRVRQGAAFEGRPEVEAPVHARSERPMPSGMSFGEAHPMPAAPGDRRG